jgi:hypothetical protein
MTLAFGMTVRFFLFLLVAFSLASEVHGQHRHAFVVGIDSYSSLPPLKKARSDASAVSAALTSAGFAVTVQIDPGRREFYASFTLFLQRLRPDDEVVFFFAGHGVEVSGQNYLLPSDISAMRTGDESLLISQSIPVTLLTEDIKQTGARVAVLILDACRDNPFAQSGTRGLGAKRGLAQVSPPAGTFVLYSASSGQAALDTLSDQDPDPNSVFTRALLPLISVPGLPAHELARTLRADVVRLASSVNHAQRPAYYDELDGEFTFSAAVAPTIGVPAQGSGPLAPIILPRLTFLPTPAIPPASLPRPRADVIRETQVALTGLGCNSGVPDGVVGHQTIEALKLYTMLRQYPFTHTDIGDVALLQVLEAERERVCSAAWIADRAPMALSADWNWKMTCPTGHGATGTALLVVDQNSNVRGLISNERNQNLRLNGQISNRFFSGRVMSPVPTDPVLAFELPASIHDTKFQGLDSFGCFQEFWR